MRYLLAIAAFLLCTPLDEFLIVALVAWFVRRKAVL